MPVPLVFPQRKHFAIACQKIEQGKKEERGPKHLRVSCLDEISDKEYNYKTEYNH